MLLSTQGGGHMDFDQISILSPLELSLRVAGLATLISFVAATLMAWLLARKRGPLPALLDAVCTLPLVLPPTVLGYYLILLVGRRGLLGQWLADVGINLIFSWQGAVVAATVVVRSTGPTVYVAAPVVPSTAPAETPTGLPSASEAATPSIT